MIYIGAFSSKFIVAKVSAAAVFDYISVLSICSAIIQSITLDICKGELLK